MPEDTWNLALSKTSMSKFGPCQMVLDRAIYQGHSGVDQISYRLFGQDQMSFMHFFTQHNIYSITWMLGRKKRKRQSLLSMRLQTKETDYKHMPKWTYNSDNDKCYEEKENRLKGKRAVGGREWSGKLANLDRVVRKGPSGIWMIGERPMEEYWDKTELSISEVYSKKRNQIYKNFILHNTVCSFLTSISQGTIKVFFSSWGLTWSNCTISSK